MASASRGGRFRLDLARYRLLDNDRVVRLERQPMELLILLARRPGDLLTREDISATLWPKDVHVDFDQSINRIVRKVRMALHDDSDRPQYIETVVGKGYRFVGSIEILDRRQPAGESSLLTAPRVDRRWWRQRAAAALGLAAGLFVIWRMWGWGRQPDSVPTATVLTAFLGDETSPTFSPDGLDVAFAWSGERRENWDIYTKRIDSLAPPRRLTSDAAPDTMPAWSPDGRTIAFIRQRGSDFELHVIPSSGGAGRALARGLRARLEVDLTYPAWFPDSKSLVVADADLEEGRSRLLLISTEEGRSRPLVSRVDAEGRFAYPAVSPDGTALAYESCDSANVCTTYVVPLGPTSLPTGEGRAVTHDGHAAAGLGWGADSRTLVFGDGLRRGLYRIRLEDDSVEHIALAGPYTFRPVISHQGDRLAYVRSGRDWNLWKFAAGGRAAPVDFASSTMFDGAPAFSPDSRRVAFASDRDGNGRQIWVANADGSGPVALTPATGRVQGSPQWSPDGQWIAYDGQASDGHQDIYVVAASGGTPRRVTQNVSSDFRPSWSHDGAWIYFSSTQAGKSDIWRVPSTSTGAAERLTTNGGRESRESRDGSTLYYMRAVHGALFERSLSNGQEHQMVSAVHRSNFCVTEAAVYYMVRPDPAARPYAFELRRLDLATRRTDVINRFDAVDPIGLSVSSDGQTLISSGVWTSASDDLWLIRNFR